MGLGETPVEHSDGLSVSPRVSQARGARRWHSTEYDLGLRCSAWNSGLEINIDALIDEGINGGWDEVVALDVIGSSDGSVKNTEYMKSKGSDVMPVFHFGEDWEVLDKYCKDFPRVGLSCSFISSHARGLEWVKQCFARQWPHCFHSFGRVSDKFLGAVPFDTADATSWQMGPSAFGQWRTYGKLPLRRNKATVAAGLRYTVEIHHVVEHQRKLEHQWAKLLRPVRIKALGPEMAERREMFRK